MRRFRYDILLPLCPSANIRAAASNLSTYRAFLREHLLAPKTKRPRADKSGETRRAEKSKSIFKIRTQKPVTVSDGQAGGHAQLDRSV